MSTRRVGPALWQAVRALGAGLLGSLTRRLRPGMTMANGRNDGPPDLDELWRDFNRKLSGLFAGKGGKGDAPRGEDAPPPGEPDMRSAGLGAGLIAFVVAVVWAGSGFFIVQEGHEAVVTTFGKYSYTAGAGFQWRFPYPVQAHETVPVTQLRSKEIGRNSVVQATGLRDSSMLTQDENIVDIRFTVQYRLKDARAFLFENRDADAAVEQAAESAVREIVGKSRVDQVLYEQRDAISAELVKSVQVQLDRLRAGIVGVNVNVQNVQVPEQVQAAFNDAVKAGADRDPPDQERRPGLRQRCDSQGTRHRGAPARRIRRLPPARHRPGRGRCERFRSVLTEYQKAPGVTRDRLYLETCSRSTAT